MIFPPAAACLPGRFAPIFVPHGVRPQGRRAFFFFPLSTTVRDCLHPKDTRCNGCLVGAYLFSGAGYGLLFSSFSFGGPPRGLLFSFMVDGVFFWNAFSFLEVIFSGIPHARRRCVDQGGA